MNPGTGMFNTILTCHWFSEEAEEIWSDLNMVQGWLDVEAALASAQAELGMIPLEAAQVIVQKADARLFDLNEIAEGVKATMHPLVPFLSQFEAICGKEAGAYIHWGATSQNIIDGGAVLQLRWSHELMMKGLEEVLEQLAALADKTKDIPQAGRTHGQHALPITFGFKVAAWHEEVRHHRERLMQATRDAFVICMGGAVGTFASMEGKGRVVQDLMAQALGLSSPVVPVRTSCDGLSTYVCLLGLMGATFEKIAQEIIFLQRTEIDEAQEGFHYGKIGSSTMPQKRNPQLAMIIVGMAQMLRSRMGLVGMSTVRMNEGHMSQELIMSLLLPEVSIFTVSIVEKMEQLIGGLKVNADRMLENLNATGGLILSESVMLELARYIGRPAAHHAIYNATLTCVARGISFEKAIREELAGQQLPDELDLKSLLVPQSYLGEAQDCVERELRHSIPERSSTI
ncbi:adenylosuccinate lyase family protein [Serratia fonticola]|uniref:class-II fumarase/aspartase family protein n=1 Tax=Serratia fonticola TaxID=47917 RepID=UPI00192CA844|nr:adenylosuccinate lyase family protein [Serratia fonticola]MBL5862156.1 adenylosuccinate lyase family protein [Serratia fonticola]CAI2029698.1 3-carboxy-cis,cis-muconate cycloisomerase [Serratia fonticola]